MTGFQARSLANKQEVIESVLYAITKSHDKRFSYVQTRLASALDVFKSDNRQVTMQYSDFRYSVLNDNKRLFNENPLPASFYDSRPYDNDKQCSLNRYVSRLNSKHIFNSDTSIQISKSKYNSVVEIAVRKFIRCLFSEEFGLTIKVFKGYKSVCEFINYYNKCSTIKNIEDINIKPNTISAIKRRPLRHGPLPLSDIVKDFVDYVYNSSLFESFDKEGFMYNSMKVESQSLYILKLT
jgi:hypothetical protein